MKNSTFDHAPGSDAVLSAAGMLADNRQVGWAIRHGTTFVWLKLSDSGLAKCTSKTVYTGSGRLSKLTGGFLLHDETAQMNFRFSEKERVCGRTLYKIVGDPYAYIASKNESQKWEAIQKPSLPSASLYLAKHFNYYEDQMVSHLNRIQRDLFELDRLIDNSRLERLLLLSQFSPVTAAESLRYPQCHALQSFGLSGILTKCVEINVTSSTQDFPRCGHQPVTRNFTIGLDGKTLVPKSKCLWKNSFVNCDGIVHEFFNDSWRPVNASYHAQTSHTRAVFARNIDASEQFLSFKLSQPTAEIMTLMGELNGLIAETNSQTLAGSFDLAFFGFGYFKQAF